MDLQFGPLLMAKAGIPKIEAEFSIDVDQILHIQAKDTSIEKNIKNINATSVYTGIDSRLKEQMKEMINQWLYKSKT